MKEDDSGDDTYLSKYIHNNQEYMTKTIDEIVRLRIITMIIMYNCGIENETAKMLASFMSDPDNRVTTLVLKRNQIGDDGMVAIADSLKNNRTLVRLDMSNNNIRHRGAMAVFELFKANDMVVVDMTHNKIRKMAPVIEKLSKCNRSYDELMPRKWYWDSGRCNRAYNLIVKWDLFNDDYWWKSFPNKPAFFKCSFGYVSCAYDDQYTTLTTVVKIFSEGAFTCDEPYGWQQALINFIWETYEQARLVDGVLSSDYYEGELGMNSFEHELIENPTSIEKSQAEFFVSRINGVYKISKNRGFNKMKHK